MTDIGNQEGPRSGISRRHAVGLIGLSGGAALLSGLAPDTPQPGPKPVLPRRFVDVFGVPDRGRIDLPGKALTIDAPLLLDIGSVHIRGVAGSTQISSGFAKSILRLGDVSDVVFEDIAFRTDVADPKPSLSLGVLMAINSRLRSVTFVNCSFSAPSAAVNGIKIVTDSSEVDGLHFENCTIRDVGRMGMEVQSHQDMSVRYEDVRWEGGLVSGTGRLASGMGISLSGVGRNCFVDSKFVDNRIGIEAVGCSATHFTGRISNERGDVLSFTGARPMEDNVLTGITCLDRAVGNLTLRNQTRLRSSGGRYLLGGGVRLKHVTDSMFTDETYSTGGRYALLVEGNQARGGEQGPSTGNRWVDCTFDNSSGDAPEFATVRFTGPLVSNNLIDDRSRLISRGGGRGKIEQMSGARANGGGQP